MTPDLQQRLERSMPPFDGMCVHNVDGLSLAELRVLLKVTVAWLEPYYPDIRSYRDWHEHDGFLVDSKPDRWSSLIAATASEQSLFDSRDEDYAVRIAFYPTNFAWLLRYNIDEEEETDQTIAWCDYDLTVSSRIDASMLIAELLESRPGATMKSAAASWFRSSYGG